MKKLLPVLFLILFVNNSNAQIKEDSLTTKMQAAYALIKAYVAHGPVTHGITPQEYILYSDVMFTPPSTRKALYMILSNQPIANVNHPIRSFTDSVTMANNVMALSVFRQCVEEESVPMLAGFLLHALVHNKFLRNNVVSHGNILTKEARDKINDEEVLANSVEYDFFSYLWKGNPPPEEKEEYALFLEYMISFELQHPQYVVQ